MDGDGGAQLGRQSEFLEGPRTIEMAGAVIMGSGFVVLFIGRFGLGDSFRIGSPKERTQLTVDGLFGFSRNPMYLGVYATLLASVLYTLNPLLLVLGIFVVIVHHKIVLAEEQHLRTAFGDQYAEYCSHVRRCL